MGRSKRDMMSVWMVTTQQWMQCAISVAECYTSLIDPRPDLARPARTVKLPYFWWW